MSLEDLKEKTLAIRDLYRKRNELRGARPDTSHEIVMEFVSDVGDLSRYITQADREGEIEVKREEIARELAECLSHILLLSEEYDINLEEAFLNEYHRLYSELA